MCVHIISVVHTAVTVSKNKNNDVAFFSFCGRVGGWFFFVNALVIIYRKQTVLANAQYLLS